MQSVIPAEGLLCWSYARQLPPCAGIIEKKGYNAFALIYRPGAQSGCEDLARAIHLSLKNADELEVDTTDYSLWGGSAGGWLGSDPALWEEAYPARQQSSCNIRR